MPLFEVAFTAVPNVKALESGKEEEIVLPPTSVIAKDSAAAVAAVAAAHSAAVTVTDNATLKTHVRMFPPTV